MRGKRIFSLLLALCLTLTLLPATASAADGTTYSLEGGGTITVNDGVVTGCSGVTDLVIPSEIDGQEIVVIGQAAFRNNGALKSVTLPDTIRWQIIITSATAK